MHMDLCFLLLSRSLCTKESQYLSALTKINSDLHVPNSNGLLFILILFDPSAIFNSQSPHLSVSSWHHTLLWLSYLSECSPLVSFAVSSSSPPPPSVGEPAVLVSWLYTLKLDGWFQDLYLHILNINLQPRTPCELQTLVYLTFSLCGLIGVLMSHVCKPRSYSSSHKISSEILLISFNCPNFLHQETWSYLWIISFYHALHPICNALNSALKINPFLLWVQLLLPLVWTITITC